MGLVLQNLLSVGPSSLLANQRSLHRAALSKATSWVEFVVFRPAAPGTTGASVLLGYNPESAETDDSALELDQGLQNSGDADGF